MNLLKRYQSCLFVLASVLIMAQTGSANYSATLFEQNSNREKKLYTFDVVNTNPAAGEVQTTYKDLQGNVVVQETSVLKGSELVRTEIDHRQLGQKGIVEVKDGKAYFTKVDKDGKSTTKEEKLGKTFVVSANFQKFVRDNWEAISGGKTVEFRYGVWDRQETVGFEVFKIGEEMIGEQKALALKMKPSSFLIAALVKPIIFKFAADGSKLLEMNGRVAPKRQEGNSWKDLDCEVTYQYPPEGSASAAIDVGSTPVEISADPPAKPEAKPAKKKK